MIEFINRKNCYTYLAAEPAFPHFLTAFYFTKQAENGRISTVQMILQNGVSRLNFSSDNICIFFKCNNSPFINSIDET